MNDDKPADLPSETVGAKVEQQAEVESQAQRNPSVDADSFGEQGGGVSKRVTQGDGSISGGSEVADAAADDAEKAVSTATKVASATDDALEVAAAGEGFLDPFADVAAIGAGLGLMAAGQNAKHKLPAPPAPLRTPNPGSVYGVAGA